MRKRKTTQSLAGTKWSSTDAQKFNPFSGVPSSHRVDVGHIVPEYQLVSDKIEAREWADYLVEECSEPVAVDTEHDGDRIITAWSFSDGEHRVTVPAELTKYFKSWLESTRRKLMHHAYHDIPVFKLNGIELGGFYADTMILDWFVDENRMRHGLKACAADWLNIPMADFADLFSHPPVGKKKPVVMTMDEILAERRELFYDYAALDAYCTWWLYQHHRMVLVNLAVKKSMVSVWDVYQEIDRPFTVTLIKMAEAGMRVDESILFTIGSALDTTIRQTRHVFASYAPTFHVTKKKAGKPVVEIIEPENINLKSPQQLSAMFYDELGRKTVATGRDGKPDEKCRSVNEEHLKAWEAQGCMLSRVLLMHRRAATYRGTFIGDKGGKGLLSHVHDAVDGHGTYQRITTELNQIGAVTGRLASRAPNLQNIPARKEKDPYRVRRAFIARKGCKFIVADYSGAELRLMAHLSKDAAMVKAFRKDLDLHSVTAKNVFSLACPLDEVKDRHPDERNKAKAINFGLQYGMKAFLLSKQIGVSRDEAQGYIDGYFNLYSGVYLWMKKTVQSCKDRGYVRTVTGRRRYVKDIYADEDKEYGKLSHAENQAMNAPIQGSVADIIKIAMNRVVNDPFMIDHEARLVLQVHDELIVECPELDAHVVRDRLVEIMRDAYTLIVPLVVEAAVGDNWEDAKA